MIEMFNLKMLQNLGFEVETVEEMKAYSHFKIL